MEKNLFGCSVPYSVVHDELNSTELEKPPDFRKRGLIPLTYLMKWPSTELEISRRQPLGPEPSLADMMNWPAGPTSKLEFQYTARLIGPLAKSFKKSREIIIMVGPQIFLFPTFLDD